MTPNEIKAIQKTGIDFYGNPLKVDGALGNKTNWWIGITSLSPLRQEVLRIALGYHAAGMAEDKNNSIANDGTFVDMLLAPVGLRYKPWCCCFISHCMRKAGVSWPVYYASAYQLREWGKANKLMVEQPVPGDLEILIHEKKPGDTQVLGHARIITGYEIATGNTSGVDGNVTDCVRVGYRRPQHERYFLRPPQLGGASAIALTYPQGLPYIDNIGDR